MNLSKRTEAFIQLGEAFGHAAESLRNGKTGPATGNAMTMFLKAAFDSEQANPWFSIREVIRSLEALACMLEPGKIRKWMSPFVENGLEQPPLNILVIMAGNIPLVGFHDMLCVLLTGNRLIAKLSSGDELLPKATAGLLLSIEPGFAPYINFSAGKAAGFDAVIATGSNNTSRYFDYYFGNYPHIIRRNRNSIALIQGDETEEELRKLAVDVFSYYGLGCRNVSQLWIPESYEHGILAAAWKPWAQIMENRRYRHNYEYQRAIFQVNRMMHTDTGFVLLAENESVSSPTGVIHLKRYKQQQAFYGYLNSNRDRIQCAVIPPSIKTPEDGCLLFGDTQLPEPWDYADGVNTLEFLIGLQNHGS